MFQDPILFERSQALREKAHNLIPGGCHTYAKGDDQYPEAAPAFLARGSGCHVWDLGGNEYIEYGMGLRAVTLGHAFPATVEAAYRQMLLGNNFTRPAPVEVECAEAFLSHVRTADMVKFAKDGSTVTTAAVKLARAYTGREMVAICADHPFYSYNDWFIGTTEMDSGIPPANTSLTVRFRYNDFESLRLLFEQHSGKIACVLMEAARTDEPRDGFLHRALELCHAEGALFVVDEMITGFRWHNGGAQEVYGFVPDLSCFGKALANGFSLSALAGKRDIMKLGGIRHDKERVFLLSTTHGAENHALAAAIATMAVYRNEPVVEHLYLQGERLRTGIEGITAELGIGEHFRLSGRPCNLLFATLDRDRKPSQLFRTLFLQEMIKRGVIAPSFTVSYSHTSDDIDQTVIAARGALEVYRQALEDGVERYLVGAPVKPVYRRYN
jgi:glutamate-1-semialdehyde 2,1-aminomutase